MRVTATARGYYRVLREPGESFDLQKPGDFSKHWMAPADKAAEKEVAKAEKPSGGKRAAGAVGGGKKKAAAGSKPAAEQPQGVVPPEGAEGGTGDPYADGAGFDA